MKYLTLPEPGTFKNLLDHQQQTLRTWLDEIENEGDKVGLWVYGDRNAGSTYVGSVAVKKLAPKHTWEYVSSTELMDALRHSWHSSSILRSNPSDYDLYVEATLDERELEKFWEVDVLWVDDLVDYYTDMSFWISHVQEKLEKRVKSGKPTIVCTNMAPDAPALERFTQVIKGRFVTCYAER